MKSAFRSLIRPLLELQLRRYLSRHNLKLIAIAGSVGKTSTKAAVATVVAEKYRVRVDHENYNDSVSVPLAGFGLEVPKVIFNPFAWLERLIRMEIAIWSQPEIEVVVLELGTDHPGELAHFMKYLKPDFGVVTAIAPEHMEFFKTIEAVAEEEFTLARGAKQAVLNNDQDRLHPLAKNLKTEAIWYSSATIEPYEAKLKKDFRWVKSDWPDHLRGAMGAAAAIASELKLNDHQIIAGLSKFKGVSGRMQKFAGIEGSTIIDDTYNSSPEAVLAAMTYFDTMSLAPGAHRIAVMGRMNELGPNSPRYHTEVGAACAGVDYLITIGDMANDYLGPAAVSAGLDPTRFKPADSPYAAGEYVKLILGPGDLILVKGSQNGVFAEETVKKLLARPSDVDHLVRQSPSWLATKAAQFTDAEV